MNRFLRIAIVLLIALFSTCTKPTEGLVLIVNTDVIKQTALVHVVNGTDGGPAPSNATIHITSTVVEDIYEASGKKDIQLIDGVATFGVSPKIKPTVDNPVKVNVEVTALGFMPIHRDVVFDGTVKQQVVELQLIKEGDSKPPLILPPLPEYKPITLSLKGLCKNKPNLELRPNLYVFFKVAEDTSSPYRYLGYLDKGTMITDHLVLGETYKFQISFGNKIYYITQKIEELSYDLAIDLDNNCGGF